MKKTNRNLAYMILGRLVSLAGGGMQAIALPLYVLDRTGSGAWMGSFLDAKHPSRDPYVAARGRHRGQAKPKADHDRYGRDPGMHCIQPGAHAPFRFCGHRAALCRSGTYLRMQQLFQRFVRRRAPRIGAFRRAYEGKRVQGRLRQLFDDRRARSWAARSTAFSESAPYCSSAPPPFSCPGCWRE